MARLRTASWRNVRGQLRPVGTDPIQLGLVTNLNRPSGNVTGATSLSSLEDNRNGQGGRLCRKCRWRGGSSNHRYLTLNQISCHCRQPIIVTLRPAVLDHNVLAVHVASFLQTFKEC